MQSHRYDDIIHLPHHRSATRAPISGVDRAAQFAPFAALTGFGAAVQETARWTEHRPELEEDEKQLLDRQLRLLGSRIAEQPPVTVTYFQPDPRKVGGAILTTADRLVKLDHRQGLICLTRGIIPVEQLLHLDSPLFSE